jgi:molecular chaperone GrpE (heat shock protein)
MEKTENTTPEPHDERQLNAKAFDQLFETDKSEKPRPVSAGLTEQLDKQLEDISSNLKTCHEELSRLASEVEELKAADRIITDLSTRYRDLSEQFYEREVLLPVINCLIRMADGCHQQIDEFQKTRAKYTDSKNESALDAITVQIDLRKADLAELENTLANLQVESYQHQEDTFDPSQQKCLSRIECEEILDGHIANRLLPGYRRYDKIIRKECVNVYVLKNKTHNTNNGGN